MIDMADSAPDAGLLDESAALALQWAPHRCRIDPASGDSCAWLHGYWQVLRLVGVAATPDRHARFYRNAFARVSGPVPRVLVSGAADYAMLALLLHDFRARGIEPDVTVIDACDTPLDLNRWFADKQGLAIRTQRTGMLEYNADGEFDLICTHSFIGQFSPAQRPQLVAAWRRALRPGGLVATVHPMLTGEPDTRRGFAPGNAQLLCDRVAALAGALETRTGIPLQAISDGAAAYARARNGYAVSPSHVKDMFDGSGFGVEMDIRPAEQEPQPHDEVRGPAMRVRGTQYANLIATRLPG